ncbi:hypothetical protein BTR23_19360 [Alkalihalophilus pseudofirmus]|nr:hypothetical protein BTR23_19360 [Alkalihalophilus pseudofirmus]
MKKFELCQNEKEGLQQLQDYISVLNNSSILAVTDGEGFIVDVNDTFCKISQYSREELIGKKHNVLKSGYHDKAFYKNLWETIMNGVVWEGEIKNRRKDGSHYWVKTVIFPFIDDNGKPYKFISARTDITMGKEYEQELREQMKTDFKHIVRELHNLVFKVEEIKGKYVITLFDGQLAEVWDRKNDIINKAPGDVFSAETSETMVNYIAQVFQTGENISFEIVERKRYFHITLSPVLISGNIESVVGSASDLTELKQSELKIMHMAYHNHITDLPNRVRLIEDLKREMEHVNKTEANLGIILIDLDRFKHINDTAGHLVGDAVIIEVGKRISKTSLFDLVGEVKLYHLGGDEFVLMIKGFREIDVNRVISRLYTALSQPFAYKDVDFYLTLSVGVGLYDPSQSIEAEEELLKQADLALLKAKDEGRNSCQLYTPQMNEDLIKKIEIESDIRKALEREEFVLYFQPQMDLFSNQMIGVEALIRWLHPTKGLISPAEFIPVAEETGLIIPIGEWVLNRACKHINEWKSLGINNVKMSVNIATSHFKRRDFSENVLQILSHANIDGDSIELEINESSLLENTAETTLTLEKLRKHNIRISIDDFGTGYSSLGYLKSFPITTLKIDQSFIRDLMSNEKDRAIVSTIINLAKNLKLEVVAEGVETEDALNFLKNEQCDVMQGYYYSKPLPAEQFINFVS